MKNFYFRLLSMHDLSRIAKPFSFFFLKSMETLPWILQSLLTDRYTCCIVDTPNYPTSCFSMCILLFECMLILMQVTLTFRK